jgi:Na+-translocating ferredoxin:NAD+ oxidoreductase subunit E
MDQMKNFTKGFFKDNPIFVMLLGMCPALAVTNSAINGLGMGLATTFVLIMANSVIALVKDMIPNKVRIPTFIVIIASFVTIVDLVMAGYAPALHAQLGIFIPLIVVNCLVLGRAEAFGSRNKVGPAFIDGLGMGLGFAMALTMLGVVRELFGNYSFFDNKFLDADGILVFILPPGAFIALGFLIAFINKMTKKV